MSTKRQLLPYAIVVLLGYIGFALPLPILPEMFLDPERSILPLSFSMETKTFLLGLMMASYPLGQLVGAPLLGQLSDRYGRKKIILISLSGTTMGYLLTALATSMHQIVGIFFGLLICGFFEGNVAIAQSVIADLTHKQERAHKAVHFGWINLFVTFGFIIGPLIGGQLADTSLVPWFTFATPFWIAAFMTLAGIIIIALGSKETRSFSNQARLGFFRSITNVFKVPGLKRLYAANFFLALGFFSFFRFFPVFLERTFDFSSSMLAYVIAYDSIFFGIALLLLIKPIAKKLPSRLATAIFSVLLALMFIVTVLPRSPYWLFLTVAIIGICLAVSMTNASVMVSNVVDGEFQGQAMGSLQSVQVLAEVLTGILGGLIAANVPALPMFIGASMAVICSLILFVSRQYSVYSVDETKEV
ncbi:MAG TPA: MFS transporter [Rhabdochlamydiaceae bacterium]|nr:MFS transporter [Rhabdochlamydiaceae bacterium]